MEQAKTHPILIAAGVAVLIFSALGVGALTGVLPTAIPKSGDQVAAPEPRPAAPPATQAKAKPASAPRSVAQAPAPRSAAAPCPICGVIESINAVEVKGKTSGLGAVAGGVAGGLLGNQFGHGTGKAVMTIGGAAGGAFAGDAIEGHVKKQTVWRITVRLEDGTLRTLQQAQRPPFAVGERVRIVDGKTIERA